MQLAKLKNQIFGNLPYKIAALILACLFWYIVQGEEILEINRTIIVNLSVPDGVLIKGNRTRTKDATLRGPRVLLGDFSGKPLEAEIAIKKNELGQQRIRVDKTFIKDWDNRIKLTVHDAYLSVFTDVKKSKKVRVTEYVKGVPADGYIIEKNHY